MEEALNIGRQRSFNKCMKTAEERLAKINDDMKRLNLVKPEMLQQLQILNDIINQAIKKYKSI